MRSKRFSSELLKKFRPTLESLEERLPLAVSIAVKGDSMVILGDNAANMVDISDDGTGGISAKITGMRGSVTRNATGIKYITVNVYDGADIVNYKLTNTLTTDRVLEFLLGRGDDRATLDASTGVDEAALCIAIEGFDGVDNVGLTLGTLDDASVGGAFDLGRGNDTARIKFAGDLEGYSYACFNVDGADGNENISVDATNVNIAEQAGMSLYLEGENGLDTINVAYSGVLKGGIHMVAEGGQGNDTIAANFTIRATSFGKLLATVDGGRGDDNLTLNVFDNSGGGGQTTLQKLKAVIVRGGGKDTITKTPNVQVV